jgi:hypothetical protein
MKVVSGRPRVVVVGGAGVFGRRLVRMLCEDGAFEIVVAGRDLARAKLVAKACGASAARLDRDRAQAQDIRALNAWCVVDASGPFAIDGPEPFRLAKAALGGGAHYLDIADGRDFVCAIGALDLAAREANRVALSGASTTPALSSAVCDVLVRDWQRVESLEIGVSPGNRAPRGLAVVKSILRYAGRPVRVFQGGAWGRAPGWGLLTRADLSSAVQGRWFSLCDTPDLELFPERYRVRDRVIFRGGLELSILHLGLWAASQLVRMRILPSLSLFAEMARDLADVVVGFGTDMGGMIVTATGTDAQGAHATRTWTLIAEGGDGPNIPVLAAFACLKKLNHIASGARPCMGEVTLAEFDGLFRKFQIRTEMRDGDPR